ncbi:beta-glucosidase [Sphingopyxis panaciterrulae]|uniref:Beta-glucosidase n=1 Tax=Sphingopyxis panaciterrulae TaxID=462372 RepID=A0A7W9B3A1_9SPHN|nr:glycoside hydrolase family 3 protein [Sphingopyxis panaciterrulae]MBB5705446.1 beta-glucosidase [Sphingopyxis panaciterrulae]
MKRGLYATTALAVLLGSMAVTASAQEPAAAAAASGAEAAADAWAAATEARMTDDERFTLLHGFMPIPIGPYADPELQAKWPDDVVPGAGYVAGIARLGIPSLRETDASLGVTNPFGIRKGDTATALPAGLAIGASFNPDLAFAGARAVASEARAKGFNVLLGGGINLVRDPRGGRNFEYISEDPLLSGIMGAEAVRGAQSAGVVSTVKHFSLNSNETNRHTWNAEIDEAAHRESDLLAFQIAIERGRPGSVMCAYNLVNGQKACGNDHLLNKVLKQDWGYKGWVMSDWGAVSGPDFALRGLDQQSGEQLDKQVWFDAPLKAKLADGSLTRARLSDMVRRILRSMKANGLVDAPPAPAVDMAAHARIARQIAEQGIVLLKNDGDALPLAASVGSVAVIGRNAHVGVLSGGGSSQGLPPAGWAASIPVGGGEGSIGAWRVERWFAGAPLAALKEGLPGAKVGFDPGLYPQDAAALAARSDVAIVFVSKYEAEGFDSPDLSLPGGQDAIVAAVAAANPNTIVVLETGNPVAMPWLDKVKAVVAAWYPGQEGAAAIADVLTGKVNPSGRLPISFPAATDTLPRPTIPSYGTPEHTRVTVRMNEGSDVGYRWNARTGTKALFPFGHGLSYTRFASSGLRTDGATATLTVRNSGDRAGATVAQLYLVSRDGQPMQRLVGFRRVELAPGAEQTVEMTIDPRLLATWNGDGWTIAKGDYRFAIGDDAETLSAPVTVAMTARSWRD